MNGLQTQHQERMSTALHSLHQYAFVTPCICCEAGAMLDAALIDQNWCRSHALICGMTDDAV